MVSKKNFKEHNPLDNLLQKQKPSDVKADGAAVDGKIGTETHDREPEGAVLDAQEPEEKPKKRAGRKKTKTEPQKAICIEVPESVFADVEVAKKCYDNNLTKYINILIKRDLESNLETYKTIVNDLEMFKQL